MATSPLRPDRIGLPPYVKPVLQSLDRMRQRATLEPDQITDRAATLLAEKLGVRQTPVEVAFAHGAVGLLAGHTHYFNGFAVLMPLAQGTAVAARFSSEDRSRLVFEGDDLQWTFDVTAPRASEKEPPWVGVVEDVVQRIGGGRQQVDLAVVSTVPPGCVEAYLAALGVAAMRTLQALFALAQNTTTLLQTVTGVIATGIDMPFSLAYLMAAEAGRPGSFTLVDTATQEYLPIDAPPADELGWGLIDVGTSRWLKDAEHWNRKEKADKALALLRKRGFEHITSFRDLEHRDLQRALSALPRSLRPLARHLVTENRRVQRLVVALRRRDWQMFGALLLMSHASLRDDWGLTDEAVDFVVEQIEAMSIEGMHGACVTGRSGCVLLLGQPFVVPLAFDRVAQAFDERFERVPEMLLL